MTPVDDGTPSRVRVREDGSVDEKRPSGDRESSFEKPLLASEALMEDLAPVEPGRVAARVWCAALGAAFIALGVLALLGWRPGGVRAAVPSFVLGGIALIAALTRVPYRRRAVAMVVLGGLSTIVGIEGAGPAAGIAVGGPLWGLARMLAATLLPAALLFRSRYRAYSGARWVLAGAFALSLPFAGYHVARLLQGDLGLGHLGEVAAVLAVLASLAGFMGAETTGAASYIAFSVVGAATAELALAALSGLASPLEAPLELVGIGLSALAFAGTAAMTALGIFQILAWRFTADARRIDLHQPPKDPPHPVPSSPDWTTRA